jgi:hypothetical protein
MLFSMRRHYPLDSFSPENHYTSSKAPRNMVEDRFRSVKEHEKRNLILFWGRGGGLNFLGEGFGGEVK